MKNQFYCKAIQDYIDANLDKHEEYYMISSDQETGVKHYIIITNLYCDPLYHIDLKGDYTKGFYRTVKRKVFNKRFKGNTIFVETNNTFGYDRVIYKKV